MMIRPIVEAVDGILKRKERIVELAEEIDKETYSQKDRIRKAGEKLESVHQDLLAKDLKTKKAIVKQMGKEARIILGKPSRMLIGKKHKPYMKIAEELKEIEAALPSTRKLQMKADDWIATYEEYKKFTKEKEKNYAKWMKDLKDTYMEYVAKNDERGFQSAIETMVHENETMITAAITTMETTIQMIYTELEEIETQRTMVEQEIYNEKTFVFDVSGRARIAGVDWSKATVILDTDFISDVKDLKGDKEFIDLRIKFNRFIATPTTWKEIKPPYVPQRFQSMLQTMGLQEVPINMNRAQKNMLFNEWKNWTPKGLRANLKEDEKTLDGFEKGGDIETIFLLVNKSSEKRPIIVLSNDSDIRYMIALYRNRKLKGMNNVFQVSVSDRTGDLFLAEIPTRIEIERELNKIRDQNA